MKKRDAIFVCNGQVVTVPVSEKLFALTEKVALFFGANKQDIFKRVFEKAFLERRPMDEKLLEDFLKKPLLELDKLFKNE